MKSRQDQLQEDTYFRVLRLLEQDPRMTQRELARALGLSLGGVNYCVQALVQKGWVKIGTFRSSPRKMAYAYLLTPKGLVGKASLAADFLRRKMDEYEALRHEIRALQKELT